MKYLTLLTLGAVLILAGCKQGQDNQETAASNIGWVTDWNAAFAQAKEQKKPVLVDFYATWCGPCKLMDKKTFPDPAVAEELKNWIPVKIDVDKNQELAQKYNIQAIPTMVLLDSDQKVISRETGFLEPDQLIAFAKKGRTELAK